MNAKLGFLSLLVGALAFLAPLTAQAAPDGSDRPTPAPLPPSPPELNAPTGPILCPAPQPAPAPASDPVDDSQDTSSDQDVPAAPAPEAASAPAVSAPPYVEAHYSMDDLAQSMQSLSDSADSTHYSMDDIAESGL